MTLLTKMSSWKKLEKHCKAHYRDYLSTPLISSETSKATRYSISTQGIALNYNEQCIDETALQLLIDLADECSLPEKIHHLFSGYPVNNNGHIPALHTALRALGDEEIIVNGMNVVPEVLKVREQMRLI